MRGTLTMSLDAEQGTSDQNIIKTGASTQQISSSHYSFTPSASYTFTTQLSLGSQGLAVTALQQRLTAEGDFSGQITGYFGAQTEAALKKFQTAHSLEAVGITGPQTRALLNHLDLPRENTHGGAAVRGT